MTLKIKDIERALRKVKDPAHGKDIVSLGMVQGLQLSDNGDVVFMLEVDAQRGPKLEPLRQDAERAVLKIRGVKKVTAVLTAERSAQKSKAADPHGMEKNPRLDLHVRHIIAIASGKGGVGKSTVAANLAVCMSKNSQLKIGLLDADIYGPSQPKMMCLEGQKPDQIDGKIIPLDAHGIKVMSIGFMIDGNAPLVWRGPMVQTAVYQLLRDVKWGTNDDPLDILFIDMPPGTGDAQLAVAQKITLAGAVIVSTPQDIALIDARKGVEMFKKVDAPILGMIENMSTHVCSNCGHEEHIFDHGGAEEEASKLGIPFLGAIPLDISIRQQADNGNINDSSESFKRIAQKLQEQLCL